MDHRRDGCVFGSDPEDILDMVHIVSSALFCKQKGADWGLSYVVPSRTVTKITALSLPVS